MQESIAILGFPTRGMDVSRAYGAQHPGTTRTASNVRAIDPLRERVRGGQRAGLEKLVSSRANGANCIQHLQAVVYVDSEAYLEDVDASEVADEVDSDVYRLDAIYQDFLAEQVVTSGDPREFRVVADPNGLRQVRSGGTGAQANPCGRALPTITWANPSDISPGTPLSGTQLNASASVAGAFEYFPVSGTVLGAGSAQEIACIFTPTDTAAYRAASKIVQINVV